MELIVFDLDGTLLNRSSTLSDYTADTLRLLGEHNIAYTVATGRTLHATRDLIDGQGFHLPQIYKNGVVIWQPGQREYTRQCLLTADEIRHVVDAFVAQQVTPFIFTLEADNHHAVYHPPLNTETEHRLAATISQDRGLPVLPVTDLPGDAGISNVSALGPCPALAKVTQMVADEPTLVAYTGTAIEDADLCWVDIHHSEGSKGNAVSVLRKELGASRVICFGDSDNDLSMFAEADECYAPENAKPEVLAAATAVIGHHDEDGIARFLRKRFSLPDA